VATIYQFVEVPWHSGDYPVEALIVKATVDCGRQFPAVGAILEPRSENPCLLLYKPLGVNGVQTILSMLAQRKQLS